MKDDVPRDAPYARIIPKTVFNVMCNTDTTEGRGREFVLASYDNRVQAVAHAKGNYIMGTDCPVKEERVSVVKVGDDEYYFLGAIILSTYKRPACFAC